MDQNTGKRPATHDFLKDGSIVVCHSPHEITSAATNGPTIVCFHGSGKYAAGPWAPLLDILGKKWSWIMFDRGPSTVSVAEHVQLLQEYLRSTPISAPYILLAHSYGGTFAKQYLYEHPQDVAGIVLVETGKSQEPANMAGRQPWNGGKEWLGSKPLVVIRGDSLKEKRRALDELEHTTVAQTNTVSPSMTLAQRQMLAEAEKQDKILEKAQLQLSKQHRYVHLPDCGHHVVRDRPDAVLKEVQWVIDNLQMKDSSR